MTVIDIEPALTEADLRTEFTARVSAARPLYPSVSTHIASAAAEESYEFMGSVPPMRAHGTGSVSYDAPAPVVSPYSIANEKFDLVLGLSRDDLTDRKVGKIRLQVQDMGDRAAYHPDSLLAALLVNGESAGFHASDGKPFFSTIHEVGKSGLQSNKLDFDIATVMLAEPDTPNTPSAKTLTQAFGYALEAILGFKDDRGNLVNGAVSELYVVCHPRVYLNWRSAIAASSEALENVKVRVFPLQGLTSIPKFFVLRSDAAIRPFIFQIREELEFSVLGMGSEGTFTKDRILARARARYGLNYGLFQNAVRVLLT